MWVILMLQYNNSCQIVSYTVYCGTGNRLNFFLIYLLILVVFLGIFSVKSDWKILKKIKPRICLTLLLILDRGSHMTNCSAGVMSLKQVVQMINFWTNLVWEPIEPQNALLKYYCTTWPCLMLALPIVLWISTLLKETNWTGHDLCSEWPILTKL